MSCKSYDEFVEAREAANEVQDLLMEKGLNKDQIFNHPEWKAAIQAERMAYMAHLEADD